MSPDVGTCEWLAAEIDAIHLLPREDWEPIVAAFIAENPYADAAALAEHLVRAGQLTMLQAEKLLEGSGRNLILGPYILVDAIGSGSMGTVYRALGKGDRQSYAVKVLPSRGPWNIRQARQRLSRLPAEPHPALIPLIDVGTSAGQHYLVWPFTPGETLSQIVERQGPMAPARAARIGLQLAVGLQFCDAHGVFHGLIKPSNVALTPDGQSHLLDFGVGAMLADAESSDSLVDTLSASNTALNMLDCLCPEAIVDPSRRSIRGDQYGLGCTLYFALSGRFPFPDGTAFEKMAAHQFAQPTPLASLNAAVPPRLSAVVERLMQKSPELRYNNLDELIEALAELAEPDSSSPAGSGLPASVRPTRGLIAPSCTPLPPARGLSPAAATFLAAVQSRTTPPVEVTPVPRARALTPTASSESGPSSSALSAAARALNPAASVPAAPPSIWQKLAFWRPGRRAVACSLLAPQHLLPGESAGLHVVLHSADRIAQAQAMPGWRGTETIAPRLRSGSQVTLRLELRDAAVSRPMQQITWSGSSAGTQFHIRTPVDWPAGAALQGTLFISVGDGPPVPLPFALMIGSPQNSAILG